MGAHLQGGVTELSNFKESDALSVTELTSYIRQLFDGDSLLNRVRVRGELSNFRRHHSGHCYFTLKDSGASLRCVMFRSRAQLLRFEPNDGARVRITGRVSIYERDGTYQLYVDSMIADGCIVSGGYVNHSLLFPQVQVHSYVHLRDAVVLPEVDIGRYCRLRKVIIDRGCVIPPGTVIGEEAEEDMRRFYRTEKGVVLITREMLGQEAQQIR